MRIRKPVKTSRFWHPLYTSRQANMKLFSLLFLFLLSFVDLSNGVGETDVDDTINVPEDKRTCECGWSPWMNSGPPDDISTAEDETFATLQKAGYQFCPDPVDIQCYNLESESGDGLELGFTAVCSKSLGLSCSLLCSDYSVRVACCYCPPEATGPEFMISPKSGGGCLKAVPSVSGGLSGVSFSTSCDVMVKDNLWVWVSRYALKNIATKQCLAIVNGTIALQNCDLDLRTQKWKFLDRSSTLLPYGKYGNYLKRVGTSVILGSTRSSASQWLAEVAEGKTSMKNMKNFPCIELKTPENGGLSCSFGNYVSSKCTFSCDYGYKLPEDIENPSVCTDDGLFSVDSPPCEKILCKPVIDSIEHGTVTCSNGNNLDSSCIYKCNTGYALIGSNQLTCTDTEDWTDAAPSCERVICSPDPKQDGLPNGFVNCTNGAYYGSKCRYTCNEGYEMVGPSLQTCQLEATWDQSKPVCNKIECPTIIASDHRVMACTAGTDYLSTCSFSCDAGYTMLGRANSVCMADKTWGSQPPTCERKTCNALESPENGDMFCDDDNFYASKCSFTCNRGFKLEGEESLKCTDEGWNFGAPICTQIVCSRQTSPGNGDVSCSNDEIYGSVCKFTCATGFKLNGKTSTTCTENGWDQQPSTCKQITCPMISNPKNGNIFCSKANYYGSQCVVYCNLGYDLYAATQGPVICGLNGLWSNTPGTCKRIQCRDINIPQGIIMCTDFNNFNSTCTFSCKDGFNRLGSAQATCTKMGWDAQPPNCGRLTCSPPLARPSNGQIKCTTSGFPRCTFSCNSGYTLIGQSESQCQNDERWSIEEIPICEINECPKRPQAPDHGNMTCSNGVIYDSQCDFKCNMGYDLVGEPRTRCTEDKTWDKKTPTCEKISCSTLEGPSHGSVTCTDNFFYKSKCTFKCEEGYNLVGQKKVSCYHNSTWSASPPYCERITCSPSFTNPRNGKVNCTNGNNHNSQCTFNCDEGFGIVGAGVSMCKDSGWTVKEPPKCEQTTCSLDDKEISNGARHCTKSNHYQSECDYICNLGYELVGISTTLCTGDGTWSSAAPNCKEVMWCPEIPKLENRQVICRKGNKYDSECQFVCDEGFVRKPDIDTVRCMDNKRWNPAGFPACEPANVTVATTPTTTTARKTTITTEPTTTSSTTTTTTTTSTTSSSKATTGVIVPTTKPKFGKSDKVTKTPSSQTSGRNSTPTAKTKAMATTETEPQVAVVATSPDGVSNSELNSDEDGGPPIIIIAAVGAVVLLIAIVILVFIVWKKRSRKKTKYHNGPSSSFKLNNRYDHTELGALLPNGNNTGGKKFGAISMDRLESEYNRRHADDDKLFREEYKALVDGTGSREAGGRAKNKEKNRYTNILPYDHSRVILPKVGIDPDSDYINASFVDGFKHKGKFIAAQGPKENTIADFWRMIWEQNVTTVIMATNLEERKELKCAKYWPHPGEPQSYGDLAVSNIAENHLVDYTIRMFSAQRISPGDTTMRMKRNITQYHFTSWPDFGVPKSPSGILKFLRKIRHSSPTGYGPIVVHCSAGVGRTGTFICIDAMMDMISRENKIDVYSFCSQMRQQRPEMVQTEQQYIFIYQAILEHHLYGDTEVEASEVSVHIDELMERLPGNVTGMEHEFKKLTSIRIQKEHMRAGNHPANMKKNRVLLILPYDWNRVMLPVKRGQENTDYINASYIDGYRQKDAYIATQGPLPHTVEDFWRMIWSSECASIVMLTELVERGQTKCAQYWPSKDSVMFGDVEVELVTTLDNEFYTERDFRVSNTSSNAQKQLIVKQFHYHGWPEVGAPVSGYSMIELVEAVQKQQQNSGNNPIVIHCSAGAGRTGAFCALTTALEQVKAEGVLDMFQIVKCLRMQRPHMVQNLEQYEFCYRAVQEYIDSMSEYCNFK